MIHPSFDMFLYDVGILIVKWWPIDEQCKHVALEIGIFCLVLSTCRMS